MDVFFGVTNTSWPEAGMPQMLLQLNCIAIGNLRRAVVVQGDRVVGE
jgi:hypothetical protein